MKLMGTAEAARFFGQHFKTVLRNAQAGEIPHHVVGHTLVFVDTELQEALDTGRYVIRGRGQSRDESGAVSLPFVCGLVWGLALVLAVLLIGSAA